MFNTARSLPLLRHLRKRSGVAASRQRGRLSSQLEETYTVLQGRIGKERRKEKIKGKERNKRKKLTEQHRTKRNELAKISEISGSHGGEYEDGCLLGCVAPCSLPPPSGRSP
jgi:5-methylcytosine-specific restriction endonuclease McrBC GTP-binding regulatory subunit McrB